MCVGLSEISVRAFNRIKCVVSICLRTRYLSVRLKFAERKCVQSHAMVACSMQSAPHTHIQAIDLTSHNLM